MAEHVILFAGPMGAGKTTGIRALSEIEVVSTEAANTDRVTADKATTTVALDYGEITVSDDEKVRLYGVPGQRRFDFMWGIIAERAKGLVLLVHADAPDPVALALEHLAEFSALTDRGVAVVAVTRIDHVERSPLDEIAAAVNRAHPASALPVFAVDPRDAEQMRTVLLTLVASIEVAELFDPEVTR